MRISDFSFAEFNGGGKFSSSGPWIHGQRIIESHELIVVTKGTVYMAEGDREFTLRPNDYLLLHPDLPHKGFKQSEEPVEFYWIHFLPVNGQEFEQPYTGTLSTPSTLIQTARQLLQICRSHAYPPDTTHHMLCVLLAELEVQRKQLAPQNALAARVQEYIRAHTDRPLTATQVADALGYHPDHLSRILKACYGITLQQEIVNQRIRRANLLLQTTDYPIYRIAMDLGYDDPNLFEKFYCYHQGISPAAYRNSFSKIHTNHN